MRARDGGGSSEALKQSQWRWCCRALSQAVVSLSSQPCSRPWFLQQRLYLCLQPQRGGLPLARVKLTGRGVHLELGA